eukprot:Nk52_evm4s2485 gene=Nk52_evmTU4s2485
MVCTVVSPLIRTHETRRFLVGVRYVGSRFLGAARLPLEDARNPSLTLTKSQRTHFGMGVMDFMNDLFLQKFHNSKKCDLPAPELVLSSRTDAGVHALCNTFHVDLTRVSRVGEPYTAQLVSKILWGALRNNEDIGLVYVKEVPSDFHARHNATGRDYVYRFLTSRHDENDSDYLFYSQNADVFEKGKIWNVPYEKVDWDIIERASRVLSGKHNYSNYRVNRCQNRNPIRTLDIQLIRDNAEANEKNNRQMVFGRPSPAFVDPSRFRYGEFHLSSNGFLMRQVRCLVGAILSAACGKISVDQLEYLLDVERSGIVQQKPYVAAEAGGLYLQNVHYDFKN